MLCFVCLQQSKGCKVDRFDYDKTENSIVKVNKTNYRVTFELDSARKPGKIFYNNQYVPKL